MRIARSPHTHTHGLADGCVGGGGVILAQNQHGGGRSQRHMGVQNKRREAAVPDTLRGSVLLASGAAHQNMNGTFSGTLPFHLMVLLVLG